MASTIVSGAYDMAGRLNDGEGENGGRGATPSDEASLSARLGRLDQRLSQVRGTRNVQAGQSGQGQDSHARASALARGFRLSSELIAGVVVGAAIGWGFDKLLSTSPWGLIVFLLVGFAAGVLNLMRSAGVIPEATQRIKSSDRND